MSANDGRDEPVGGGPELPSGSSRPATRVRITGTRPTGPSDPRDESGSTPRPRGVARSKRAGDAHSTAHAGAGHDNAHAAGGGGQGGADPSAANGYDIHGGGSGRIGVGPAAANGTLADLVANGSSRPAPTAEHVVVPPPPSTQMAPSPSPVHRVPGAPSTGGHPVSNATGNATTNGTSNGTTGNGASHGMAPPSAVVAPSARSGALPAAVLYADHRAPWTAGQPGGASRLVVDLEPELTVIPTIRRNVRVGALERRRPRVRRVTRVVRHVDPWSVFKVAICFSVVLYGVCLTAAVLLWNVAYTTGTVDNIERFFESFGWDHFEFKGGQLFHNAWIAGLFGAVGLTGLIVLGAVLFNLITDLVGGIRVTVLEEEVVERETGPRRQMLGARRFGRLQTHPHATAGDDTEPHPGSPQPG